MRNRIISIRWCRSLLGTAFLTNVLVVQAIYAQTKPDARKSESIRISLKEIVSQEKIPGMIAAISNANGLLAIGSSGIRKTGARKELTDDDLFHIGSCTKAMTSVLMAKFVEQGEIQWDTTLIDIFPEYAPRIHPDYHKVTLWQLVTHRAGLPANAKDWWAHQNMKLRERRETLILENLKDAPTGKPGQYLYSNLGYMIAGCMAEKLTKKSWEDLMEKHLFDPLNMKSAGFGPPGSKDKINQPWGHNKDQGQWLPRQFDNAEALGPAGRVHCTIEDWAKFIALQLPSSKKSLLTQASLDQLIKPDGDYAAGWKVLQRHWAKGITLTHNGSNTMWYAVVWVAPELNRAYIVVTNSLDDKSSPICDKMIGKLLEIDKGK